MNDIEFNLLDEPWIRVMADDCKIKEVSLMEAILDAHKYKSLCGELPAQDIAVLRLILAVLHTVFSRFDENGNEAQLEDDEDEALDRWKALWEKGSFSEKAVRGYLEQWHECFWLFHPERPFGQVAGLKKGTDYESSKLNGEVSESSNKVRIFSSYSGTAKDTLTYSQAARWILYLNAYDDTSSKPTKEGKQKAGGKLPSSGTGWLGKLGLIFLTGNNLFETIMLNLVMINENCVQFKQSPLWEHDTVSAEERTEIVVPDNLAELYTLQSRRISLIRKNDAVVSYRLLGGDFFQKENAFFEPMTVWRTPKADNEPYTPKRHDSSKQLWREFAVLYNGDERSCSGVVKWYKNYIFGMRLIDYKYPFRTEIVSVEYGDQNYFVKNVFSDSLTMHSGLLSELGKNWRNDIENEIKKCDELAYAFAVFSRELYLASGGSNSSKDKHYENIPYDAKAQIYYRLDLPFRKWLREIDPECSGEDKQCKLNEWRNCAKSTALSCMYELAINTSESAAAGHFVDDKNKNKELHSAPKAINIFKGKVNKIYGKAGD